MARPRKQPPQCPSSQQVVPVEVERAGNGARLQILLVGGNGGLKAFYSQKAAKLGFGLTYAERRLKGGSTTAVYCAVVVVINPNSHPLREAAARIATSLGLEPVYIDTGSVSMVESAFNGIRAALDAAASVAPKTKK